MKTPLYILYLFLVASSAWAIDGNRTPQEICSKLTTYTDLSTCKHIIAEGGPFNELALGVCDHRTKTNEDILECMRRVQYGKFQSEVAIWACDRMEDPSDAIDCLGAIKADYFDDGAVLACERIDNTDDLMDCLDIITDKKYQFSELQECKSKPSDHDMMGCFEERGEDGPKTKRQKESQKEWEDWVKTHGQSKTQPQAQAEKPFSLQSPGGLIGMMKATAGMDLKCTSQKQGGNDELEVFIENTKVAVQKCVWVKRK